MLFTLLLSYLQCSVWLMDRLTPWWDSFEIQKSCVLFRKTNSEYVFFPLRSWKCGFNLGIFYCLIESVSYFVSRFSKRKESKTTNTLHFYLLVIFFLKSIVISVNTCVFNKLLEFCLTLYEFVLKISTGNTQNSDNWFNAVV